MTPKRIRRKNLSHTERWGKRGRVRVTRNLKGQFVIWRKVRPYTRRAKALGKSPALARARTGVVRPSFFGGKGVAVYGGQKRIQLHGTGQQLREVIRRYVLRHPPKEQFLDITAEEILMHPERFLEKGYWVGRPEIESR